MRTWLTAGFLLSLVLPAQAQVVFDLPVRAHLMTDGSTPTFFVGTSGGVFESTDERQNWMPVELLPLDQPRPTIEHLVADPNRRQTIYAAGAGDSPIYAMVSETRVYKSVDRGHTWAFHVTLPADADLHPRRVQVHPLNPNLWYHARRRAVFRSQNQGRTWAQAE